MNVMYCPMPRADEHMVFCKNIADMHLAIHIFSTTYLDSSLTHSSYRDCGTVTFGVRFREMLCPSLLRKEMGDLVLAIRAAFSSAFRSRLSVNKNTCDKRMPRNHFCGATVQYTTEGLTDIFFFNITLFFLNSLYKMIIMSRMHTLLSYSAFLFCQNQFSFQGL